MIRGTGRIVRGVLPGVALAAAALLALPAAALALPPHVATGTAPDTCAMCHRGHTASGDFGRADATSWEMTGSALGITAPAGRGDTTLCYTCHHIDALGSGTPVAGAFEETSAHSLAPEASPFGPTVKYCSSCHDSHGADKDAGGEPYAALLRARTSDGTPVFTGSAYCGTCHDVERSESRFDGVAIYERTPHFLAVPDPASGTKVRCSVCHEGHGSPIAPLIVSEIAPPAIAATVTVAANDRTFCLACHGSARGAYRGETRYLASAHAASATETSITGEWAGQNASRLVGECQVCHAPMGRDDGEGDVIATLLEREGSALCLDCHAADGDASTDLAALQYPAAAAGNLELLAAFSPDATTAPAFGTLGVWGREPLDPVPSGGAPIVGPRFYQPKGLTGALAAGDADGDGSTDVFVADPGAAAVTLMVADPLKGLTTDYFGPASLALPAGMRADFIAVADVIADVGGRKELVVVDEDAGELSVFRLAWDVTGAALVRLDGPIPVGDEPSGLAAGELLGGGVLEIVVTDADASRVYVLTESATPGDLDVASFLTDPAVTGLTGPSVGDVAAAAGIEIAVAYADAGQVGVFSASGTRLGGPYPVDAPAGARPVATLVADALPGQSPLGTSGAELAVAVDGGTGIGGINVFAQNDAVDQLVSGVLAAPLRYDTGAGARTGSLAAGDIDGDGRVEIVAGSGGSWDAARAPSLRVYQHDIAGAAFVYPQQDLWAGGAERAGSAPSMLIADVGAVGPSRHPVGAVEDAHVATETAPFARHVECADCHNAHEATSTVAAAPAVYGRILGAWGVSVTRSGGPTYGDAKPVAYEYELCYKCHSAAQDAAGLEGSKDIAERVSAENVSVHAIEASVDTSVQPDSFVAATPAWAPDSVLYCTSCHGASAGTVAGPHASADAPILKGPYRGTVPSDGALLCYGCHKRSVYFTSAEDTQTAASWFGDVDAGPLHGLHVRERGFGCAACHDSHGSPVNRALVRDAIVFTRDESGGSCVGPCHPGAGVVYTR